MESFMFAPVELLRKGQANEVSQVGPHHPQHSSLSPPGQRCLSLPSLLSLLWDFVFLTVASCRVLIESNENRQRLPPAPTRRKPYIDTSLPFLLLCSRRKPIYSQAVVATYVYIMTSGAPMQPRKRKTSLPARVFAPRAPN